MSKSKAIGLTLLFGLFSIITVFMGVLISFIMTVLSPFIMVFTGLWITWFVCSEHEDEDREETEGGRSDK